MRRLTGMFVVMAVCTAGSPAGAAEPLALYDRFGSALINPAKWFGYEDNKRQSLAESVRVIAPHRTLGRRLNLQVRGYGRTDANLGTTGGANRLRFFNGDAVTAIRTKVWVSAYTARGTASNPDPTSVRARLSGFFFNVGTAVPGSALGDVFAQVYLRRESNDVLPAGQLKVRGSVIQCTNADCSTGTVLASADLGTAALGQKVQLLLQWDAAGNRFIVQRDAAPKVLLPYAVPDSGLPGISNNKRLEVEYDAADSTAAPRPMGYMKAYFDEVYVNRSAL